VPGDQRLLPQGLRRYPQFEHILQTRYGACGPRCSFRYDGWVTELGESGEQERARRDLEPQRL